jgi:2-keto-4-pentenoate hydratase/2-oxohepta-3-ene-1,7-dioic acid hydratase in catechol pathway
MFSPRDRDLPRGWPGKLDGDRVIQLAAQTLQAFFTGGGQAREHAVYALEDVELRAPVLQPPTVRIFYTDADFVFANADAIHGPEQEVRMPAGAQFLQAERRVAAVMGADGAIGGFTLMNDWNAPELSGAKALDFALSLGPFVVTPDEFPSRAAWPARVELAARNTRLLPGDVIAAGSRRDGPFRPGDTVEVALDGLGVLRSYVVAADS